MSLDPNIVCYTAGEMKRTAEALRNLYVSACDTRKGYADKDLHEPWQATKKRAYEALVEFEPSLAEELEKPE